MSSTAAIGPLQRLASLKLDWRLDDEYLKVITRHSREDGNDVEFKWMMARNMLCFKVHSIKQRALSKFLNQSLQLILTWPIPRADNYQTWSKSI